MSPAAVSLDVPSAAKFNVMQQTLQFSASGTTFHEVESDVNLTVNGVVIPESSMSFTFSTLLEVYNVGLASGANGINLSVFSSGQEMVLSLDETVWVGTNALQVNLVISTGSTTPFTTETTVVARLADDLSVGDSVITVNGTATFFNVPDRTIIIEARSVDNDAGTTATLGSTGVATISMSGFNEPSTVDNNDFSSGTDGWDIAETVTSVSIVEHVEDVGPNSTAVGTTATTTTTSPTEDGDRMRTPIPIPTDVLLSGRQVDVNNDLRVRTMGLGEVTVKRTFITPVHTTGIRVRYRFVTSEIPGGYFGSRFNDYFSVSIRSREENGAIFESASMNGLGLAAFDSATGSTAWRQTILPLESTSDVVEVAVTVANVGDGAYDSFVDVDFVEVLSCDGLFGEGGKIVDAIGLQKALTAYLLSRTALIEAKQSGLPGAANGPQDAFRHCLWSCLMAKEIGVENAKIVGDLHEICRDTSYKNSAESTQMDLKNNEVGRGYGAVANADCSAECMKGIGGGDLQTSI